jgi:hypothetical protein
MNRLAAAALAALLCLLAAATSEAAPKALNQTAAPVSLQVEIDAVATAGLAMHVVTLQYLTAEQH